MPKFLQIKYNIKLIEILLLYGNVIYGSIVIYFLKAVYF